MNRGLLQRVERGFTLIELMVVVVVVVVILVLAAPSFREMMDMQRLRGTSAQLVTDVQFARSEAASRQEPVQISFDANATGMTCYIIHTCGVPAPDACRCECSLVLGSRCAAPTREIKTVQVLSETGVQVTPVRTRPSVGPSDSVRFDPVTGGMEARYVGVGSTSYAPVGDAWAETSLIRPSNPPSLRTMISTPGRPSVCSPSGRVSGVTACP